MQHPAATAKHLPSNPPGATTLHNIHGKVLPPPPPSRTKDEVIVEENNVAPTPTGLVVRVDNNPRLKSCGLESQPNNSGSTPVTSFTTSNTESTPTSPTTPQDKATLSSFAAGLFSTPAGLKRTRSASSTPFTPEAKRAIASRLPDTLELFDDDVNFKEIDIKELELQDKLAEGAYGTVWRGMFHAREVAVKIQRVPVEDYEQVNILSELSILRGLVHPRLVKYEGAALLEEEEEVDVSNNKAINAAAAVSTPASPGGLLRRAPSHIKPASPCHVNVSLTKSPRSGKATSLNDDGEQHEKYWEREEIVVDEDDTVDLSSSGNELTSVKVNVPMTPFKVMIVMELCENGALREGLLASLSWGLKIRIAADVAEGLDFLHRHQLIHRDLKTTNILLDSDWRAKICDHSFAISEQSPEIRMFTCGTFEFMSPEMIMGEAYDARTDLFSYGVVLAEMVTEREPGADGFLTRSPKSFFEISGEEITEAALPGCPPSFLNLALQCVKSEVDLRPSAEEAVDWLKSLAEEMNVGARQEKSNGEDGGQGGGGSDPGDRGHEDDEERGSDDSENCDGRDGWRAVQLPKGRPPPPSPEPCREGHVTRPSVAGKRRAASLGGDGDTYYYCCEPACRDDISPAKVVMTVEEDSRRRSWPLRSAEIKGSDRKLSSISSISSCCSSSSSSEGEHEKKAADITASCSCSHPGLEGLPGDDAQEGVVVEGETATGGLRSADKDHRHRRSQRRRRRRKESIDDGKTDEDLRLLVQQLQHRVDELQLWKERTEKQYGAMVKTVEDAQSKCTLLRKWLKSQEDLIQTLQRWTVEDDLDFPYNYGAQKGSLNE